MRHLRPIAVQKSQLVAAREQALAFQLALLRLLVARPVAYDRIGFTNGASSQNDLGAGSGPIVFELVRWGAKWDERDHGS